MGSQEVAEEYRSSLNDLTLNSKPLITMLTMLAEENLAHAALIVKVIAKQIQTSSYKLPLMYLIDSILKNVGKDYIKLFAQNIIEIFTYVFEKVDEKTRKKLYELRHTWNDVFAKSKLYMLDTKVQSVDPAWPVTAVAASGPPATSKPNIHINPNLISGVVKGASRPSSSSSGEKDLKDLEILKREEEILELKKKRLLLEQKKKDMDKNRSQPKPDAEIAKPEPPKPASKPSADPSVSKDKRSEFLKSYKIKKKSQIQIKEEAKVSSNIHVDPRRVHQVLPQVAAKVPVPSRDPRSENSRDPRVKSDKPSRDPRNPPESSRDPRIKPDTFRSKPAEASRLKTSEVSRTKAPEVARPKAPEASRPKAPEASRPKAPESSRDPRLAAAAPVTSSTGTVQSKPSEAKVTSSRDPRVSNKIPVKKATETAPKPKKEAIPKRKKTSQKAETPPTRETRSSKSAQPSKEPTTNVKAEEPDTTSKPATPASTFKSTRSNKSRTYKKREESPEDKDLSQNSSQSSSSKRSRSDHSSISDNSDDSDHYMGNVPKKSQYKQSSKKAKKPDVKNTPVISDTDYRHFTPPKHPVANNENVSPPKNDKIMDEDPAEPPPQGLGLFSNQDVDYRQILPRPMTVIPTAAVPPIVPPVFSSKDQDDRNPSDNPDLIIKNEMAPPDELINTPLRNVENRMRKPSFNSPHAASWEKFREKNPEFKEYTRQASISESEKSFLSLESDDIELGSNQQHGFPVRIRDMGFPPYRQERTLASVDVEGNFLMKEEEPEDLDSPRHSESSRENYKVILSQAEDQMRRGEISMSQYNQLLTTVVTLMEKDKIQQARVRDRHLMRTPQPEMKDSDEFHADDSQSPLIHPGSGPGRPPIGGPIGGPGGIHGHNVGEDGPPRPGGRSGPVGPGRGALHNEGRGAKFMRNEMPMNGRGGMVGRGGRGSPGPNLDPKDRWGRGGSRGRGGRGMGHMKENRNWGSHENEEQDDWIGEPELPFLPDEYLQKVNRENITNKIEIDGIKRDVRTYGQNAVVFLECDDPRILTFGEGQVDIVFDGNLFRIKMRIGEDYREFTFEGVTHRVRLGPPSQELMLDDTGYHCLIGGDPVTVYFDGKPHHIRLEGTPPNVNIGPVRNTEFVAGMTQLVIQAEKFVPLFLDAKPQRFNIDGRIFVIKFVDSLKNVLINNRKFRVDFGGLPISICVRGFRRFLSFGNLPHGIIPGQIAIRGMEGEKPVIPLGIENTGKGSPASVPKNIRPQVSTPCMSRPTGIQGPPPLPTLQPPGPIGGSPGPGPRFPGPHLQGPGQGPVPPQQGLSHDSIPPVSSQATPTVPLQGPLPPSSAIAGIPGAQPAIPGQAIPPMSAAVPGIPGQAPQAIPTAVPGIPGQGPTPIPGVAPVAVSGIPPIGAPPLMQPPMFPFMNRPPPPLGTLPPATPGSYTTTELPSSVVKPPPIASMPLDSLLNNLQRLGWIGNKESGNIEEEKNEDEEAYEKDRAADDRIPIELMLRSEQLRKRRKWVIDSIYRGMQCSSCGLRYPPEQTVQYSHHLDWHFRKNKKQQESTKKANTRKFYFSIDDWLQYEEIEDVEERVQSIFETEGMEEAVESGESEIPSVPVTSGELPEGSEHSLEICPTCHDKFESFFHQDTEEWRYRNAIQFEGLNYHPFCHQDNIRAEEAARLEEKMAAEAMATEGTENGEKEDVKENDEQEEKKQEATDANAQINTDTLLESEELVTTKQDDICVVPLPPKIKPEPIDVEDGESTVIVTPMHPEGIVIKKEIKKEPEDRPEELIKVPDEDEDVIHPPETFNAATDIASSIDGNTELTTTATTNTTTTTKIVFNVSKPALVTTEVSSVKDNNDLNSNLVTEEEYEEFIPPPFTVDYKLKPAFKDVELIDQPVAARGIELSGLCSIM